MSSKPGGVIIEITTDQQKARQPVMIPALHDGLTGCF